MFIFYIQFIKYVFSSKTLYKNNNKITFKL